MLLGNRNKKVHQSKKKGTTNSSDLLPEVDVENFAGEVEVDVGVVGVVSSVGDGHV